VAFLSQTLADDKRHPLAVVQGDAITQRDGKSVVFVIRDGVAHAVAVTPGQKINDDVELSGISAVKVDTKPGTKVDTKVDAKPEAAPKLTMTIGVGDRVVLKPTAQIEDGKRVSVAQK
jgi:hypothetical protein